MRINFFEIIDINIDKYNSHLTFVTLVINAQFKKNVMKSHLNELKLKNRNTQ